MADSVAAVGTSIGAMTDVIESIKSSSERKVIIELENRTDTETLFHPLVFMWKGQVLDSPQPTIPAHQKAAFSFCKHDTLLDPVFGVCTYDVCDSKVPQKTLCRFAVMFSMPFNRLNASNEFGLGIFPPETHCDRKLLDDINSGKSSDSVRQKADGSELGFTARGYTIKGTMSQTATAIIKVEFHTQVTKLRKK